jgi:hypothetical protein
LKELTSDTILSHFVMLPWSLETHSSVSVPFTGYERMFEFMSHLSGIKKTILIALLLSLFFSPVSAGEKKKPRQFDQPLKKWVGKRVNVDYEACDPTGCVLVRSAMLKEVTEDAIIVIVNGSPFLIPKYMVKKVELSR